MDQCEDREEGVPPSKSTLCGEHESQTKAQRSKMEKTVPEQLLDILDDLGIEELERFHFYLQYGPGSDFTTIKKSRLEDTSRTRTVDFMVETYTTDRVMEVTELILKKIKKGFNFIRHHLDIELDEASTHSSLTDEDNGSMGSGKPEAGELERYLHVHSLGVWIYCMAFPTSRSCPSKSMQLFLHLEPVKDFMHDSCSLLNSYSFTERTLRANCC